jgi:hypothetical protein
MKRISIVGLAVVCMFFAATSAGRAQDQQPRHENQEKKSSHEAHGKATQHERQGRPQEHAARPQTSQHGHEVRPQTGQHARETRPQTNRQAPREQRRPPERAQRNPRQARPTPRVSHGGYRGRIPFTRYHAHFGRDHRFRMTRFEMVGGRRRFYSGGYWFVLVSPWPAGWVYNDYYYIEYINGGYYLFNPQYPSVQIAINVVL